LSEEKKTKSKELGISIFLRILLVVVAYVLVVFICPLIWGSVTLECVVIIIVIAIAFVGIIPGIGEGGI